MAAQLALLAGSTVRGTRDAGPDHSLCEGVGQAQEGGWHKEGPSRVEIVIPLASSACQELFKGTADMRNRAPIAWIVAAAAAAPEAMPPRGCQH